MKKYNKESTAKFEKRPRVKNVLELSEVVDNDHRTRERRLKKLERKKNFLKKFKSRISLSKRNNQKQLHIRNIRIGRSNFDLKISVDNGNDDKPGPLGPRPPRRVKK